MKQLFRTNTGCLHLLAFLEGSSLLLLVFVAVPLKYFYDNPTLTQTLGPLHGALFLLFFLNTVSVGMQQKWPFAITGKVLLACFIPFGTFYVDHKILKNITTDHK